MNADRLAERLQEKTKSLQLVGHSVAVQRRIGWGGDYDPVPFQTLRHLLQRRHDLADRNALALRRCDAVHLRGRKHHVNPLAFGIDMRDRLVQAVQREPIENVIR